MLSAVRGALAVLLLLSACARERIAAELPLVEGEQALLLVVGLTEPRVYAMGALGLPLPSLHLDHEDPELYLLGYTESLSALRFAAGEVPRPEDGRPGRLLPPSARLLGSRVQGEDLAPWTALETRPAALAELRVADPDWTGCVQRQGCYQPQPADGYCTLPCPQGQVIEPPQPPQPPLDPDAPQLPPCPQGWALEEADPLIPHPRCRPPAPPVELPCPQDQVQLPGAAGCAALVEPCAGPYPESRSGERPLYVRPGAQGGDGTSSSPFGALAPALAAATGGQVLLLAPGLYPEEVQLPDRVSLRGCGAATRLQGGAGVVLEALGRSQVEDLILAGGSVGAWVHGAGRELELRRVLIEGTVEQGALAEAGGRLSGRQLVIRDSGRSGLEASSGAGAALGSLLIERPGESGVRCSGGAQCELSAVAVRGCVETSTRSGDGLYASGAGTVLSATGLEVRRCAVSGAQADHGAELSVADAAIRQVGTASHAAWGLAARRGARLTVSRADVEGGVGAGVLVVNPGSTATISEVVVRGQRPRAGEQAYGAAVSEGASLRVRKLWVADNVGFGVAVFGAGTVLDAEDLLVLATHTASGAFDSSAGVAVVAARARFDRLWIGDSADFGLLASGSTLSIFNLAVLGAAPERSLGSAGVAVLDGAHLQLSRGALERSARPMLLLGGERSAATVDDLQVADAGWEDGDRPFAVQAVQGSLTWHRGILVRRAYGVSGAAAQVELEDLRVSGGTDDTASLSFSGGTWVVRRVAIAVDAGGGIDVEGLGAVAHIYDFALTAANQAAFSGHDGAELHLERALVSGAARVGIDLLSGAGRGREPTLEGTDVQILGTRTRGDDAATGARLYGGRLRLERFLLADNAYFGLSLRDGVAELSDGSIRGSAVGCRVDVPGYDLARLLLGVHMEVDQPFLLPP